MDTKPAASILFIEKVFLKPRKPSPLRGVELFNLYLLRDLAQLGHQLTVVAHTSWRADIEHHTGRSPLNGIWVPSLGIDVLHGLVGAWRAGRRHYDCLLIGNVGNGITPCIAHLKRREAFDTCVVIAHREATHRFVGLVRDLPGHIVCVNETIAKPFRQAGHPHVCVDYGVMNADQYKPAESHAADGNIHFCVVGMLDNAWKGADTAIYAFRQLPSAQRQKMKLHLCSYTQPPTLEDNNIQPYGWMAPSELPDFLRGMDVMIVPSHDEGVMRETFSQASVQGMLTGLPLIVSNLPILTEKVDEGGGLVYGDHDELVAAMASLANDRERREAMGRQARETAQARYVWDTGSFVSKYIQV